MLDVGNDGGWVVYQTFEFEYEEGDIELIRPGFRTDLLSSPFFARPIIRTWGKWTKPAVVHDHDYSMRTISRKQADRRFLKGLEVMGVWWATRIAMYYALRGFGWWRWHRFRGIPMKLLIAAVLILATLAAVADDDVVGYYDCNDKLIEVRIYSGAYLVKRWDGQPSEKEFEAFLSKRYGNDWDSKMLELQGFKREKCL